jgi:ubiquinone/menaquinone biosynthesis C-methylase UbiE
MRGGPASVAGMSTEWFEGFFSGIAAEMWSRCMPQEATRAEVDFLKRALKCKRGARILDVPCGNGRHSLELARRGYKVTGLDLSSEFIESARRAAKAQGASVEWICADMRSLKRRSEFDGALCFGNSFGYMGHDDSRAFLKSVFRALKPGARFVLQAGAAEVVLPRFREREWAQVGDIMFLEHNEYSPELSCVETTFTFIQNTKVETRRGRQFLYTAAEIRRMLEEAGFKMVGLYGGLKDEPFRIGNNDMLYVVSKK